LIELAVSSEAFGESHSSAHEDVDELMAVD